MGVLSKGDIVQGDIVQGGYCPGGYCPGRCCPGGCCPGGYCPGGYCPGGYCPRTENDGWEAEFTPGNIQEFKDSNDANESSLSRVVNESDGPAGVVRMGRVRSQMLRLFAGRVGSGHDFVI